jgi:hypothetical protein
MFTRIVELTAKPGKNKQLSDIISDKVLPILKKQRGSWMRQFSSPTKTTIVSCP